jgi:hypothetical protein
LILKVIDTSALIRDRTLDPLTRLTALDAWATAVAAIPANVLIDAVITVIIEPITELIFRDLRRTATPRALLTGLDAILTTAEVTRASLTILAV